MSVEKTIYAIYWMVTYWLDSLKHLLKDLFANMKLNLLIEIIF